MLIKLLKILVFCLLLSVTSYGQIVNSNISNNKNPLFYYLPDNYPDSVKIGNKSGDMAPDICLQSLKNDDICLADLKGNLVLIQFWSSKCKHCRTYNKDLVNTYLKYKDTGFINGTGFEIFSVSLDNNYEDWTQAIREDSLIWLNHGSDYMGWATDLKVKYDFIRTPTTFLIDGEGIIITKNSFGPGLDRRLHYFMKK